MTRTGRNRGTVRLLIALAISGLGIAPGAEIRLRTQCETSGAVLTLGEVAEIFSSNAEEIRQLAAVELGPAPPPGQQRFLRVREIQDALWTQRVNLVAHQFTGYGLVAVTRAVEKVSRPACETTSAETRQAMDRVEQAVAGYLRSRGAEPGKIEFQLSEAQVRAVLTAQQPVAVSGGMPPWTRQQRMELAFTGPDGESRSPLDVRISTSANVVVPLRALARGAVVRLEDVQLSQITNTAAAARAMPCSLEQVVGRETTRAVPEGKPLESGALRSTPLVRRGDVVTVFVQAPGLKVKTMARARDDAGLGEQVTLESLHDRKPLLARVVAFQEAEAIAAAAAPRDDRGSALARRSKTNSTERTAR